VVLSAFWELPIFGHGISSIFYNSGGQIIYPHNMLLQIVYDGGLLMGLVFIYILIGFIRNCVKSQDDQSKLLLFLGTITIPKMLFSSDMWTNLSFFILCGLCIKLRKEKQISELD